MIIQEKRVCCISCGTPLPESIVKIGDQYPSAIFVDEGDKILADLAATNLDVTRCPDESCALVQLSNQYDLQYVFDHYPYESGSTATMKGILQAVVDDATHAVNLTEEDVVLDIGGNDGTLLSLIRVPVKARVNIDAAASVNQVITSRDYVHIHSRFTAETYKSTGLPSPRLITSVAMFYHLNNPLDFCRNVREIMSDESVWILQMTYLGTMLKNNIFDNIVHEHAAYYSLASLEALLAQVGLHIAEAKIVESYGGSLRVMIVKEPKNYPKALWRQDYPKVQEFEKTNCTNTFDALYAFNSRAQLLKDSIRAIVDHLVGKSGPLWGFGASTKGNMILQFLGITPEHMSCILDNGSKKIGKFTTGSMIPIIDEASFLNKLPDYLFVLPYYYTEAFVKIIRNKLPPGKRVNLIVPLPYPHFITVENS